MLQNISQIRHPLVKWAQRKDRVFLQIGLRDITEQKIDLTVDKVAFNGVSDSKKYNFDIELFSQIDVEKSKWTKTGFHLLIILQKKEDNKPYWPRLSKGTAKNQYIQIDWAKWIDQDDEEEEAEKGMGALDPSQMQAFRGYPGMDQPDEDDEEQGGDLNDLDQQEQIQKKQEKKVQEEKVAEGDKKND